MAGVVVVGIVVNVVVGVVVGDGVGDGVGAGVVGHGGRSSFRITGDK